MERASVCGLLVVLLLPLCCSGQGARVFTIDTVVGGAVYDNRPAIQTPLNFPTGLWLDREGGLWVADTGNQVIRRIDPSTGLIPGPTVMMKVMVGGGTVLDDAVPVPADTVRLDRPSFLVGDAAGNIYFSDTGNNRVRRWSPDGSVTTVVGTGELGFAGDGGFARLARLNGPTGLVFDTDGSLYIADAGNCRIRRVDSAGVIRTFAGTGRCAYSGDGGPALNAVLESFMAGLALDSKGNLYLAADATVRRIDQGTTIITTVIGTGVCGGPPVAGEFRICGANHIAFDSEDNLYFTHSGGVVQVSAATGRVTNIPGGQGGLVLHPSGAILSTHLHGWTVGRRNPDGFIGPLAGTPEPFDGPGRLAVLTAPGGVAVDTAGNLLITERGFNGRIRRFEPATGQVSTIVGGGSMPPSDGIAATDARLGPSAVPSVVFVDSQGNVFFNLGLTLWKMDARTRTIARIAGRPDTPFGLVTGDGGPALEAALGTVGAVTADRAGNLYIGDLRRVRRIDAATGIITTIAGNGSPEISGDGGPATEAAIGDVRGLAFDLQGNLLIATSGVGVASGGGIRRVNLSTGVITSVQVRTREGETPGRLNIPAWGLSADREGNLFFTTPSLVFQVRASDSMLLRLTGSSQGFFGEGGLASLARLSIRDGGIAPDASGNLYVADSQNGRVRKLTLTTVRPVLAVSPGTVTFTAVAGSGAPAAQALSISSTNLVPFNWTLEVATSAGGNWLSASATSGTAPSTVSITADASRLGPGTYRGTVTVRAADASNSPQSVEVALTVQAATGSLLGVSQEYLNFQAAQGGATPPPQTISISNAGSGALNWSAIAETSAGGPWLRLSAASGTAPSTLTVSVDASGLAQGVYQGRVVVRNLAAGDPRIIAVVLLVTRTQPILLPTQTGFLFVGLEGSLVIGAQSFAIQNAGQGRMDWQIQVTQPSGGDWLRVSPLSGTSEAGRPAPEITLQVDPTRLRAGVYVALLTITAAGALNSPQTAIVLAHIAQRGSLPVGLVIPPGLIFTTQAGASGVLTQPLTLASTGGQPLQFLVRARTQAGGNWLSVTPEQGTLLSSSESLSLQVEARPAGLSPGVYFGSVTFGFGTGATQEVAVALVVASGAALAAGKSPSDRPGTWNLELGTSSAQCTPRRLVVVETRLGNRFALEVGWPAPILAQAVDDCGTPVGTATVTASFTTGEAPLVFQNLRDGRYSATWVPATRGQVGITIRAVQRGLEDGVVQVAGTLGQASLLPLVFREGWVNAASFDRFKPLAPGMIFSVFGNNLGEAPASAAQIPLPRQMGSLKVTIGGIDAPLFYSDSGQVNAQVPFELAPGAASLVASSRGSAGAPGTVTIVAAQPGIFTMSQTGTGQGVVVDAAGRIVDANNPVRPGEAVVIYATGLGMTEPRVGSGEAAPRAPLARVVAPLTASIGGREAGVDFAGLTPDLVGLYQVNARVPEGVAAGAAVPVVITQNGVASNTVTIAVQ